MSALGYTARAMQMSEGRQHIGNEPFANHLTESWGEYLDYSCPKSSYDPFYEERVRSTALVFENTFQDLPSATRKLMMDPRGPLQEADATTTGAIDSYASTIFPVLMRVFPNLIAHELVSIQPMSGPVGAVFYLEYKYARTKGRAVQGQNMVETLNRHYTSEYIDGELVATADGTNFGGAGSALTVTLDYTPVIPKNGAVSDPNYEVRVQELNPAGVVQQTGTDDGAGGFVFSPAGGSTAGAIDYATGSITGFKFQNAPTGGNEIRVEYFYNSESNTSLARGTLDIELQEIRAKSRKMNIAWSAEAADDLRKLHGIEGEAQLLVAVSNEIGLEIDREIIEDISDNAAVTDTWDRAGAAAGETELDYLSTLLTTITDVSARIHTQSKRQPANWIVTSPRIAALFVQFQRHGDFIPAAPTEERPSSYGNLTSDFGIFKYGTLHNRFSVYQDPYLAEDEILMGFKGRSYLDAGYVYAPYVPLQMTPTFLDPDDHEYKKGLRSRYAKKMLRNYFFGKINVQNL